MDAVERILRAGSIGTLLSWNLTVTTTTSVTSDHRILNNTVRAVDVTFDRDMQAATFTAADVLRVLGPAGLVAGPYTVDAFPLGTSPAVARSFRIGFPTQ